MMLELDKTAKFTRLEIALAVSLASYVSADDVDLNRRDFLEVVISRIRDDLDHK